MGLARASDIVATPISVASDSRISVRLQTLDESESVIVEGFARLVEGAAGELPLASSASLYTRNPLEGDLPPIMGDYSLEGDRLRFTPRFPFQAGLTYFVLVDRPLVEERAVFAFSLPEIDRRSEAIVTAVYPTSDILPENLLKFYLHFSRPMSRGNVYEHIRLLESDGDPVELPFLELGEELWDPDGMRLTLLFDPGRIKSGLRPNREVGPALRTGEQYTLQIMNTWLDAQGQPLLREFRKSFRATAPDGESPDPNRWRLIVPKANTRAILEIVLDESLDEALLRRVIQIFDEMQSPVEGMIEIGGKETRWRFIPDAEWKRGSYRVRIATILEDRAGNSVGRPFEVEMRRTDRATRPTQYMYRDFTIP